MSIFSCGIKYLLTNLSTYFLKRLIRLIPIFFIIVTAAFFLMRLAPGGPFDHERASTPEIEKNIKEAYGLDKPLYEQYFIYIKGIAKGNLGISFSYPDKTVGEIISESFPISFILGLCAFLFALLFGTASGILSAMKKGGALDLLFFSFTIFGVSVPSIVLCPLLILIFGMWLGILPVAGWGGFKEIILPAFALGIIYASFVARLTRASMLEVMEKDYVKAARGAGMKEGKVILKYALKGSLLPVVSYLAPAFAGIITGSLVIEKIFFIPGLGQHFVQAALNRDYPLALGTVVFFSAILLLVNLIADIVYALLDPGITYESDT